MEASRNDKIQETIKSLVTVLFLNTRIRIFYRIEELTCQTDCDYYKIKLSEQNWHIMAESILSASYSAENDFAPGRYNMILTKESCSNSLLLALEQNKDSVSEIYFF